MINKIENTKKAGISRRTMLKTAGMTTAAFGLMGPGVIASDTNMETNAMARPRKKIKIGFIGGGSQTWAPRIIRDIVCKPELQNVEIEIALVEIHMGRAQAIHDLFRVKFREWNIEDRVRTYPTLDPVEGLTDADFVIITIATGRLPAMSHDLDIPEKYSIYQTVGDTSGPGGWARNLRNFPVFEAYAKLIKKVAPNAFVLQYSNPMGALTKIMAGELGSNRVVGLCHGLFENYGFIKDLFNLEREDQIKTSVGGINHFFWILDLKIDGQDGYKLLDEKVKVMKPDELSTSGSDTLGFVSNRMLMEELYRNYNLMPYVGDRHTCEFFSCYITDLKMMERFNLVRTSVSQRESRYANYARSISQWTNSPGGLSNVPSREAAADMINAILYDEPYTDVVNLVNMGQVSNLPVGTVVETLGNVDSRGFTPFAAGPLPDKVRAVVQPHAEVMVRLVNSYHDADVDEALMTLAADPVCAHLTVSDSKKMGIELLEAHKEFFPDFYRR